MIVRLWVLAWAARYLKYVPILGWRFSETIVQRIEDRMDRDVQVGPVTVDHDEDAPPTEVTVEVEISNELPVDLTLDSLNVRLGYADDGRTVANVLWSEDQHQDPPANVTRSLVETGKTETIRVERYVPPSAGDDDLHVDGSFTTKAWLDVPSTKRIPLGGLRHELPEQTVELPSNPDADASDTVTSSRRTSET